MEKSVIAGAKETESDGEAQQQRPGDPEYEACCFVVGLARSMGQLFASLVLRSR